MSGAERSVVLCTAGFDHTIRFWEAPTGICHRTLQYQDSQVNRLCLSLDKLYLSVAGNPSIRLYDMLGSSPSPIQSFDGHSNNVTSIGFQRDRKWLFSGSEDGSVKIWDLRVSSCQRDYQSKSSVNCCVLHPNQGELIAADEDGAIRVWDLTQNTCSFELVPDGKVPMRSLTIAADASLLVAANNKGNIYVWRLGVGSKAGGGGGLTILEPFNRLDAAHPQQSYILHALLSPDVRLLATCASDKTIRIWNVEKGFVLDKILSGHSGWVWDCSFSADSAYLVSGSSDKTAKLWDVKTGDTILEYKGHTKAITAVALNDSS